MDDFDVVVVGSGFGGSVTAYRAAAAGFSVCVLERGQAYPPDSFARSPHSLNQAFWDPSSGRTGLFDVWSFDHLDGVVSAGLGGGSLIYANVLIRKDENWFVTSTESGDRAWPVTRADLDPHYDAVEKILKPQVFPMTSVPYNEVRKATEFMQAAASQGFERTTYDNVDPSRKQWYLPQLAVTFANDNSRPIPGEKIVEEVRNLHDRDRQTCRLTGECDLGCNYGSKNSLDYNYLTLAKLKHGADLRTLCDVKTITPDSTGGVVVTYRAFDPPGAPDAKGPAGYQVKQIRGRHLVVAAGTFGSNLLLQRNRSSFPGLSDQLGHGISGNGDLLTMVIKATRERNGTKENRILDPSHGPVITGTLRSPDRLDGAGEQDRGFYLQDAGYPGFVDWLIQSANVGGNAKALAGFVYDRVKTHLFHRGSSHLAPSLIKLLADSSLASGSMPMLGMGRDVPDGILSLDAETDDLQLDWNKRASTPFFDEATDISRGIADALGGHFVLNPITAALNRLITVHALGGCAMGETTREGVVDSWGRVHNYPHLHVVDGSAMPGPVGANPSLTIAALADRFADRLIDDLTSETSTRSAPASVDSPSEL